MKYEDVMNDFLSSVKDNDPYKSSKKLQIERWGRSWWVILHIGNKKRLDFIIQVLSDETCWDRTNDLYSTKLNIKKIGEKLVSSETTYAGIKNPLGFEERYRIACWCCFEKEIKYLFDELKENHGIDSEKRLVKLIKLQNNGPLMIFWSHYINERVNLIKPKDKNDYVFGFECAMSEKHTESLEFFYKKIQSDTSISLKQKEELLISTALYYSLNGQASTDMIEFCLRHLDQSRYPELLKKDLKKNNSYLTLSKLRSEHCIESAKVLFNCLEPKDLSSDEYVTMIFGAMRSNLSLPDNYFVTASNDLIIFMLNRSGFEKHKQCLLNDLCKNISSCRQLMVELIRMDRTEVVWNILDSASSEQIKLIMKSDDFCRFKILTEFVGDKSSVIDKLRSYCNTDEDNINQPLDLLVGSCTQAMTASYIEGSRISRENTSNLDNFVLPNIVKQTDSIKHYL